VLAVRKRRCLPLVGGCELILGALGLPAQFLQAEKGIALSEATVISDAILLVLSRPFILPIILLICIVKVTLTEIILICCHHAIKLGLRCLGKLLLELIVGVDHLHDEGVWMLLGAGPLGGAPRCCGSW